MTEKSISPEILPLSAVPKKVLERAKFVGANMDEVVDPQQRVENAEKIGLLREQVAKLNDKDQQVINARFPRDGSKPKAQSAIATEFGVTRKRISVREAEAIRKLRRSAKTTPLAEYGETEASKSKGVEDQIRIYLNGIVNSCHKGDLPRALTNLANARIRLLPEYLRVESDRIISLGNLINRRSLFELLSNPVYLSLSDETLDNILKLHSSYPKQVRGALRASESKDDPVNNELKRFESLIRERFKFELIQASQNSHQPPASEPERALGKGGINQQPQLKIPPHFK